MKKINDFSRYKNILPYDSEIFGVYQPMIGWKSKRIKQLMDKGFSADLNKVREQLFKRFRGDFEMVLDEHGVLQKTRGWKRAVAMCRARGPLVQWAVL